MLGAPPGMTYAPRPATRIGIGGVVGQDQLDFSLVPKRVAAVLSADIIFGRIEPEARIIEEDIAERFGVSRSPIRESIRLLERDGLVVREERRGARVSPLNRRELEEIYLCRRPLEGIAAREAAEKRGKDDLRRLQSALTKLRQAFQKDMIESYFEGNVAFTEAVHTAADNSTLQRMLGTIAKQSLRYRLLAYRHSPPLMALSFEESEKIVEAIQARDGQSAQHRTERLIESSREEIRKIFPG
jgi:DNA-binding GntR family transcriptional regulator